MYKSKHGSGVENKVALITGGSRGIGRAIATEFAKAGIFVAVNYREGQSDAEKVQTILSELSTKSILVKADVSKKLEINQMIEKITTELGPIDILINNAAIAEPKTLDTITEEDWDRTIDTNLKSVFLVTQAVIPLMRKNKWGRIINISSTAAQMGGIIGPHYTASKAGIIGLTHAYASQLVAENITVNTIAPALIETDMIRGNKDADPSRIPVKRFGAVEEIAQVALMLIANGYITGQTINVNGGLYFT